MVPQFEDPTTLKFVNGKFVLATNDPKNPVQLIRQLHKDDTTKVVIYLTNGVSYEDTIESLEDLIEISGNKAFEVVLEFEISGRVYEEATAENVEKAFSKFFTFNCGFDQSYYLQTSKMIPTRIRPVAMATDLEVHEKENVDGDIRLGTSRILLTYLLISPPQFVKDIVHGDGGVVETLTTWIRNQICSVNGVSFDGRNHLETTITAENLADAIIEMKDFNTEYTLSIVNTTKEKAVFCAKGEDMKEIVSFFRP